MSPDPLNVSGQRIDDADFSGARLHSPNFEGARITDGWLVNTRVEGAIDGLSVNGVEVEPLIRAELERREPERGLLRATDRDGLVLAWELVEARWARTMARAHRLGPAAASRRVDGDWSLVETLRHLVMATDSWLSRMVLGEDHPYHPWGLAGSFLTDPTALGLDVGADPGLDEVLAVRAGRAAAVRSTIHAATPAELARVCTPPATPGHPNEPSTVLECLHVILDEEYEHRRYVERDLDAIEADT